MCHLENEVREALREWKEVSSLSKYVEDDFVDCNDYLVKYKMERYNVLLRRLKNHNKNGCDCIDNSNKERESLFWRIVRYFLD
jgi:hypothetical protein